MRENIVSGSPSVINARLAQGTENLNLLDFDPEFHSSMDASDPLNFHGGNLRPLLRKPDTTQKKKKKKKKNRRKKTPRRLTMAPGETYYPPATQGKEKTHHT